MWVTIIYTPVSEDTNFPAHPFEHLGTSLKIRVWFWMPILLCLKLETMSEWGSFLVWVGLFVVFFQKCHWMKETRLFTCWLARCLLLFWSLCSMLIFTLEKASGELCKSSPQNSKQSTAASPRHFRPNWGRRPPLSFSRGRPRATQLSPRGLLCASQTRSDAAKMQRNVKDNLNSKYLPEAVSLQQKQLWNTYSGSTGEEEGNQGTTDTKNIKLKAVGGPLKLKQLNLSWNRKQSGERNESKTVKAFPIARLWESGELQQYVKNCYRAGRTSYKEHHMWAQGHEADAFVGR